MFAIVEIAGKQYKVSEKDKIEVDKLPEEKGKVSFDTVLLYAKDDSNIEVGAPFIKGAKVEAEIIEHSKGDKIKVFKKKPKKRYQRTIGHRKALTVLEIKSISMGKAASKPAAKKEEPKKEEAEAAA